MRKGERQGEESWGRGRRDNLTKLKASAISEKQETRQTWRRSGRAQAGVNSLLVLPLLLFLSCLFVYDLVFRKM